MAQSISDFLNTAQTKFQFDFRNNKRILSYSEYLQLVLQNPAQQLRGSAHYLVDMMDYFGKSKTSNRAHSRFNLFDLKFSKAGNAVIGHDEVQQRLYQTLKNFIKERKNHRFILLHGPNGSAKSSLVNCLIQGLEHYSSTAEGATYQMNWIFPIEKILKGGFGLSSERQSPQECDSYAHLPADQISARIPCDLKDHPLLALPVDIRMEFIKSLPGPVQSNLPNYLLLGSLSHQSQQIFEALLTTYQGDFKKVLMHVQVERFYYSQRYRKGVVTIEPQLHVDAQARQITMDKNYSFLPPTLQSMSLYELSGDLIEGNRGIIDFSDLLKRPVDSFKYLLGLCENNQVNVGNAIVFLDTILVGSTNEVQLDAFKEFPDFRSFKARIELVRVPYLLEYSEEEKIYSTMLNKISLEKHIAPHTPFVTALWAVLTRLKKPNSIHYPSSISAILSELTPLQKAHLYDHEDCPEHLSSEEKKQLRSWLSKIREEFNHVPYYEGRIGASAREMKSILLDAAHLSQFPCLSPLSVLSEIESFIKHRHSEYDFLRQEVKDGYHDHLHFVEQVRHEYLERVDREVRQSMGLFETQQYDAFLKRVILHLSAYVKKEKVKNPITDRMEAPDIVLIEEFESMVEAPKTVQEKEKFRQNMLSTIGAYALDNPNQPMEYRKVFPEFFKKIENFYFQEQRSHMKTLADGLAVQKQKTADKESSAIVPMDPHSICHKTLDALRKDFGYCASCAQESILFLVKNKYT